MINRVSKNPIIKARFALVAQPDDLSVVVFWLLIEAKGKNFSSEHAPAQVQRHGKFHSAVGECAFWSDETIVRPSDSIDRFKKANEAIAACNAETSKVAASILALRQKQQQDGHLSNSDLFEYARLGRIEPPTKRLQSEWAAAKQQYESVEKEMLTPEFIAFFNRLLFLVKSDNSSDELAYALIGGTVWSCVRELETKQWALLAERFIEREDAAFAAALTGDESPLSRERISTEVRRAVWIRDQGQCARCGSKERLEYDHIVPLARGGSNTERNIELLCEACNRAKSSAIM